MANGWLTMNEDYTQL